MKRLPLLAIALLSLASAAQTQAAIVFFDLMGKAGPGLIAGNENIVVLGTPGVGGEVGAGISFNDVTKELFINVGWGVLDGFSTNLTGIATAMHIHGPAGFLANAGVVQGLDSLGGFSSAANGGGFNGTVILSALNETRLFAGELYINVHTAASGGGVNPNGEIRGNLVAVPEPSGSLLGLMGLSSLALRRTRQKR